MSAAAVVDRPTANDAVMSERVALVIEDSDDQRALLTHLLQREQFRVLAFADCESAAAAFGSFISRDGQGVDAPPVLAIIDLLLPGLSGYECAVLIRKHFPICHLVISSVLDVLDYPESDAVLPKPITGASVREVVAAMGLGR